MVPQGHSDAGFKTCHPSSQTLSTIQYKPQNSIRCHEYLSPLQDPLKFTVFRIYVVNSCGSRDSAWIDLCSFCCFHVRKIEDSHLDCIEKASKYDITHLSRSLKWRHKIPKYTSSPRSIYEPSDPGKCQETNTPESGTLVRLNLSTRVSRILFAKAKDLQYTISHKIMVNHERVRWPVASN